VGVISFQKRFVFIHVPKTAGKSLQQILRPHGRLLAESDELVEKAGRKDGILNPTHMRSRDVADALGAQEWAHLYSFGFVRNPWDRMVSLYSYITQTRAHALHRHAAELTFDGFLNGGEMMKPVMRPMWEWLSDQDGRQLVLEVFRFEDLSEIYPTIVSKCGLAERPALPHLNASRRRDYRAYYTDAQAERVALLFEREIQLFGYRF
jgi:hypothetical protein